MSVEVEESLSVEWSVPLEGCKLALLERGQPRTVSNMLKRRGMSWRVCLRSIERMRRL